MASTRLPGAEWSDDPVDLSLGEGGPRLRLGSFLTTRIGDDGAATVVAAVSANGENGFAVWRRLAATGWLSPVLIKVEVPHDEAAVGIATSGLVVVAWQGALSVRAARLAAGASRPTVLSRRVPGLLDGRYPNTKRFAVAEDGSLVALVMAHGRPRGRAELLRLAPDASAWTAPVNLMPSRKGRGSVDRVWLGINDSGDAVAAWQWQAIKVVGGTPYAGGASLHARIVRRGDVGAVATLVRRLPDVSRVTVAPAIGRSGRAAVAFITGPSAPLRAAVSSSSGWQAPRVLDRRPDRALSSDGGYTFSGRALMASVEHSGNPVVVWPRRSGASSPLFYATGSRDRRWSRAKRISAVPVRFDPFARPPVAIVPRLTARPSFVGEPPEILPLDGQGHAMVTWREGNILRAITHVG